MATAHPVVPALVRRDGRGLSVEELGPPEGEARWMLPGGIAEPEDLVRDAEWIVERGALDRLDGMSRYDAEPRRRTLAGAAEAVSVVDRR